ncbi:hypothetical protein E2C01_092566 [Portunus trituberculatus]|uniref:Uncharacterized protein n=1 Tax=Portunus trituberculatus TaxID=210409 RepID=A0A5B7JMB7_PORTR|nr:hypothetical protein [Portunus trituberculatus]
MQPLPCRELCSADCHVNTKAGRETAARAVTRHDTRPCILTRAAVSRTITAFRGFQLKILVFLTHSIKEHTFTLRFVYD